MKLICLEDLTGHQRSLKIAHQFLLDLLATGKDPLRRYPDRVCREERTKSQWVLFPPARFQLCPESIGLLKGLGVPGKIPGQTEGVQRQKRQPTANRKGQTCSHDLRGTYERSPCLANGRRTARSGMAGRFLDCGLHPRTL